MSGASWFIPVVVGAGFMVLGLIAILLGKREENNYLESLTSQRDLREYITHWPFRPEPGAVKLGGWIAVVVGLVIIGLGLGFAFIH
jgi:hypothetical protein